jgi:hypothetical protein
MKETSERAHQILIEWDVPIEMDDGVVLRADVFRPEDAGRYPVVLAYGPYAKGLTFQEGYADAWEAMTKKHPDVEAGSSNSAFAHPEAGSGTLLGKQRFRFLTDGGIDQICCRKVFLEVAELDLKVDEKVIALQRHHLVAGCGEA